MRRACSSAASTSPPASSIAAWRKSAARSADVIYLFPPPRRFAPRGGGNGQESFRTVAKAGERGPQDRDGLVEVFAVAPEAVNRLVVQLLRHLRIARGARVALVLVE